MNTIPTNRVAPIGATVLGYPRIGRRRELKRALESFWRGASDAEALTTTAAEMRQDALRTMNDAGLDSVPVNTFSLYDQVLDTSVLVGAVPERFASAAGDLSGAEAALATYFAMARHAMKPSSPS